MCFQCLLIVASCETRFTAIFVVPYCWILLSDLRKLWDIAHDIRPRALAEYEANIIGSLLMVLI